MKQEISNSPTSQRITVVDALRGFALLGVILTHMLQHYGIFSFSGMGSEPMFPKLDVAIQWLLQNVIMGRFINIFAFLFGLSFFIQMDNAAKKGVDFRKRFLWRMVILFAIGVIGNCFYTGDILSIYAVFGVLMVFMYRFKNWMLIAIASLLLLGVPRIVTTTYKQMVQVEQVSSDSAPNQTNIPSVRPRVANVEKPSFFNSAKHNLTTGLDGKLNYQFGLFGRGYITLALFILGLIVGRSGFFKEVSVRKGWNITLFTGFFIATLALNYIIGLLPEPPSTRMILMGMDYNSITPVSLMVMALRDISAVLLSGALALGFIVLYQMKGIGRCLDVITPYGRMGLTNYEMQGVIGCVVFSVWGFGSIFGSWGPTQVVALGLAVYATQVIVSKYWLKYYLYGPLEWFWRSATYLKWQPLRRK